MNVTNNIEPYDLVSILYKSKQENNKIKSALKFLDLCIKKNDQPIAKYTVIAANLDEKYAASSSLDTSKKNPPFL